MGRLTSNEAATNTALSIATTALAGASTVVGGDLAKSILAGAATLTNSTRDHINVHVYRNQIAQAISKSIEGERFNLRRQILARYAQDEKGWTVDDAILEVDSYHRVCSFYKGLELVLMAAENAEELRQFKEARRAANPILVAAAAQVAANQALAVAKAEEDLIKKQCDNALEFLEKYKDVDASAYQAKRKAVVEECFTKVKIGPSVATDGDPSSKGADQHDTPATPEAEESENSAAEGNEDVSTAPATI